MKRTIYMHQKILLLSILCTSINLCAGWREIVQWTKEALKRTIYVPTLEWAEQEIILAIDNHDTDRVEQLLAIEGIDPNMIYKRYGINTNRTTILMSALERHQPRIVQLLLAHPNIDINRMDRHNETALHYAVSSSEEMIRMLLAIPGIEVNGRGERGRTPLMHACIEGKNEIVRLLLERSDIDVNGGITSLGGIQVFNGYTPLMGLFVYRKRGCDEGMESKRIAMARLFIQDPRIQINAVSTSGFTALMLAIHHNDPEIIEEMLQHKNIDIDKRDTQGRTAIDIARRAGHTVIVEMLKRYEQDHDIMVKPAVYNIQKIVNTLGDYS